jgi:hypothetical protein
VTTDKGSVLYKSELVELGREGKGLAVADDE